MFDKFLLWSVKNEYIILIRFALWLGANPNVKDKNGDNLLHILIESKNKEKAEKIADILARKDINIYVQNRMKKSPLEKAVRNTNDIMTKWLIDKYKNDINNFNQDEKLQHTKDLGQKLESFIFFRDKNKDKQINTNVALSLVNGLRSLRSDKYHLQKLSQNILSKDPDDPFVKLVSTELCRKPALHETNKRNITSSKSLSKTPNKVLDNSLKFIIKDLPLQHSTQYSSKKVEARSPDTTFSKSTTTPSSSRSRSSSGTPSPSSLGR